MENSKNGRFKIYIEGLIYDYWQYYEYKVENGIVQTRIEGNRFDEWKVGEIPKGAILL